MYRAGHLLANLYPVSHPIEPGDFVMFSLMTCGCPLVQLGLAFESSTLYHFPENLEARRDGNRGRWNVAEFKRRNVLSSDINVLSSDIDASRTAKLFLRITLRAISEDCKLVLRRLR